MRSSPATGSTRVAAAPSSLIALSRVRPQIDPRILQRKLALVAFRDLSVGFPERDALAQDQAIRLFGGMQCRVESDALGAERQCRQGGGGNIQTLQRLIDAAEQGRLEQLQVALVARG